MEKQTNDALENVDGGVRWGKVSIATEIEQRYLVRNIPIVDPFTVGDAAHIANDCVGAGMNISHKDFVRDRVMTLMNGVGALDGSKNLVVCFKENDAAQPSIELK